jgi:hypothetical protein
MVIASLIGMNFRTLVDSDTVYYNDERQVESNSSTHPVVSTNSNAATFANEQPSLRSNSTDMNHTNNSISQSHRTIHSATIATSARENNKTVPGSYHRSIWDQRLRDGGFVYFKHLRKAAGTSVRRYLVNVVDYHYQKEIKITASDLEIAPPVPWLIYHQEWSAMPWECPFEDALWNQSINVIVLRDPIERQLSEFFYSGRGASNGTMSRLGKLVKEEATYEKEAVALMKELVPMWMEEGRNKGPGRNFNANYQTKMISGITPSKPTNMTGRKITWRNGPCSYGSGRYGGAQANHNVTLESLQRAKAALKEFDLVLLTETLSQQEQAAMVANIVGVPESVATLAKQRSNAKTDVTTTKSAVFKGYGDMLNRNAPDLYELLRSTSELDIELYEHAIEVNRAKTERWRTETNIASS